MAELVFLGTPAAAVPALEAVVAAGHQVRLVVSQPDRRRGRGSALDPSPVKAAARPLGLAVTDRLADVVQAGATLGVVVAYGKIIPQTILDQLPMVNLHFSLLPRWRGAAPVERAILAGDEVTGVCLMRLEAGLDTGPVLERIVTPIEPGEHVGALTSRLARLGAELLVEALAAGVDSWGNGTAQQGEPTYAAKIEPDELRINWEQPAEAVVRQVRLDRAYTTFRGQRLRVLEAVVGSPEQADGSDRPDRSQPGMPRSGSEVPAGTLYRVAQVVAGDGATVNLVRVQPEGRRPVDATAWWHGARLEAGERLGAVAVRR